MLTLIISIAAFLTMPLDAAEKAFEAPVFPDPAVPLIQLPADFKTHRVSTDSMIKAGGSVDLLLHGVPCG